MLSYKPVLSTKPQLGFNSFCLRQKAVKAHKSAVLLHLYVLLLSTDWRCSASFTAGNAHCYDGLCRELRQYDSLCCLCVFRWQWRPVLQRNKLCQTYIEHIQFTLIPDLSQKFLVHLETTCPWSQTDVDRSSFLLLSDDQEFCRYNSHR